MGFANVLRTFFLFEKESTKPACRQAGKSKFLSPESFRDSAGQKGLYTASRVIPAYRQAGY
jgi:hypothetical protein